MRVSWSAIARLSLAVCARFALTWSEIMMDSWGRLRSTVLVVDGASERAAAKIGFGGDYGLKYLVLRALWPASGAATIVDGDRVRDLDVPRDDLGPTSPSPMSRKFEPVP